MLTELKKFYDFQNSLSFLKIIDANKFSKETKEFDRKINLIDIKIQNFDQESK
jgi:hypothetical protein